MQPVRRIPRSASHIGFGCGDGLRFRHLTYRVLCENTMELNIPAALSEKAATFPECSYGVCRVTLILSSGKHINNVILAWGSQIISIDTEKVTSVSDLGCGLSEIIDVLPENADEK